MLRNHANGDEAARKEYSGSGYRAAAAAARQWSAQAESRIVRVSRVFGGKDRHSKVKTVKGLRDRRVRLSVPTAIQLYDLQDRLGLSQPSKVVDWLLNAARDEIDKLPPLQFPPQDLVAHQPLPMPALSDDKFGVACRDDVAAAAASATPIKGDGVDGAHMGGYRFMSLNNSLGLASSAMPLAHHGAYCTGEPWNNVHESCGAGGAGSPEVVAHGHAPFPSLLSLAPGSHQLLFYSSDSGFGVKEAQHFTTVDHLGSHNLSLSSARAFHDHSGN